MRMMVIAGLNLQKLHASRYESPVMVHIMTLVTITLKNLLRNPWFFVTKALILLLRKPCYGLSYCQFVRKVRQEKSWRVETFPSLDIMMIRLIKYLKFFLKIDLLILSIYYQLISNKYVLYNIIHLNHHYVVLLY